MTIEIRNNQFVVKSSVLAGREYIFDTLEAAEKFLSGRKKTIRISNKTSSPIQFMKFLEA